MNSIIDINNRIFPHFDQYPLRGENIKIIMIKNLYKSKKSPKGQ